MQHTMSDAVARLWWGIRRYAAAAVLVVLLVTAAALALPLLRASTTTYRATAVVVASSLEIRADQLPRLAAAVFDSGVVAEETVAAAGLPVDPTELIPDHARLEPVEDNIVLFVDGLADDPATAATIANAAAESLAAELDALGTGVGQFEVQAPAEPPVEAEEGPPVALLAVGGVTSGLILALGLVGLLMVLRRPVLEADEAAELAGAPLIGSLLLDRYWDVDLRTVVGLSAIVKQLFPQGRGTAFLVACRGAERDTAQIALLAARAVARRGSSTLVAGPEVPKEALRSLDGEPVTVIRNPDDLPRDGSSGPTVVVGPSTEGLDAPQFLPGDTRGVLVVRAGTRQQALDNAARQFLPGELAGVVFTRPVDRASQRRGLRFLQRDGSHANGNVSDGPGRSPRAGDAPRGTADPSAAADTGVTA